MLFLLLLEFKVVMNTHQTQELLAQVAQWKIANETIVFTNGCFDILHRGHVDYLTKAALLGTKLIVALNTDASVKRLGKGSSRPLQDEDSRLHIIKSLRCVDAVILFDEDTPLLLIQAIQPNVLVKGGDYEIQNIVGYTTVIANGGKVLTIPFLEGYSTTRIEQKIINSFTQHNT
ncbi:MAG: D-glycero-beta-D-manno-heptose 1-phosphate adenylyltransferase [Bacteroidia bacterium]|nr:D-glycero-beta-D-manno-heptose 1-phosphate adenylyltransferase [Bacteroidia bacterium]